MLKRCLFLLGLLLAPAAAFAQGAVLQSGGAFQGHASMFLGNGYIADAGGPMANGLAPVDPLNGLLPLGFASVNSGLGTCQFSGYGSGSYSRICSGFDGSGNGLITYDNLAGAPIGSLGVRINGVLYPVPGTVPLIPAGASLGVQVATVAALKTLPLVNVPPGGIIGVAAYATPGDMPAPSAYQLSTSPCTIGAGTGDGGSQIPSNTSGNCWILAAQTAYDIRSWGLSAPIQFYANASTGNDYGGLNYCVVSALPCATLPQAQAMVSKFDMLGQGPTVTLAAGTYQGVRISGQLRGTPSTAFPGGLVEHIVGAGYASTFITDNLAQQAVLQVADGMQFSVAGVTISVPSGDDGLFAAGQGGIINVSGASLPVRFNGLSNNSNAMHVEGNNRIIIGNGGSYILAGTFNNVITVGEGGIFVVQPNVAWTCAGGLTVAANFISVNAGQALWDQSTYSGCAAVSGLPNDFFVQNNGTLNGSFMGGTLNFPFGPGYIASGGRIDPPDSPCIGGSGGCSLVVAPTGLGTGGTATIDGTGGSYAVGIILNTGSASVSTSGSVWLQYANYLYEPGLNNYGRCVANVGTPQGSAAWGSWPAGSMASITAQLPGNTLTQGMKVQVSWMAGSPLSTGTGYGLNVVCNSG